MWLVATPLSALTVGPSIEREGLVRPDALPTPLNLESFSVYNGSSGLQRTQHYCRSEAFKYNPSAT
jgi:hypothetical protein